MNSERDVEEVYKKDELNENVWYALVYFIFSNENLNSRVSELLELIDHKCKEKSGLCKFLIFYIFSGEVKTNCTINATVRTFHTQ